MVNGFFLHRRVDYHPFQVLRLHGINGNGHIDGGFEQQLQTVFTEVPAKASDLAGIAGGARGAGQAEFKVGLPAEVLPQDVLAPAHNEFFVAEFEAAFEVQEAGHHANGELGTPGIGATGTH